MVKLNYTRWYPEYINCDWCEKTTRGRLYKNSNTVICGACQRPLIDEVTPQTVRPKKLLNPEDFPSA